MVQELVVADINTNLKRLCLTIVALVALNVPVLPHEYIEYRSSVVNACAKKITHKVKARRTRFKILGVTGLVGAVAAGYWQYTRPDEKKSDHNKSDASEATALRTTPFFELLKSQIAYLIAVPIVAGIGTVTGVVSSSPVKKWRGYDYVFVQEQYVKNAFKALSARIKLIHLSNNIDSAFDSEYNRLVTAVEQLSGAVMGVMVVNEMHDEQQSLRGLLSHIEVASQIRAHELNEGPLQIPSETVLMQMSGSIDALIEYYHTCFNEKNG